MNIQDFISSQPIFKKYKEKYFNPFSMYSKSMPEKIFNDFIAQASIEEIVIYYMGKCNRKPYEIPHILASLERFNKKEIPVIEGILTEKYWLDFYVKNYDKIETTFNIFK